MGRVERGEGQDAQGLHREGEHPGRQGGGIPPGAAEAERARAPFREYLERLQQEFEEYLSAKYARKTVRKHAGIVWLFIEFLRNYTDVEEIEEITRGMVNTHFRRWYNRKVLDSATGDDLRVALKRFFQFLAAEKGIQNPRVIESLK